MELTAEDEGASEDAFGALVDQIEHGRRKMAHHEAGHLAAAWALDARLCAGNITPDGPFGGAALFRLGGDAAGASVDRVICILAGPAAERRFAPHEADAGARDREMVAEHLDALCRDPASAGIVHRHCHAEAARLVALHWDMVEAFATALLEREALTGDDLAGIVADVAEARRRRRWRDLVARAQPTPTHDTRTAT